MYSIEYQQQRQYRNLMDFLSPPQQLIQRQHYGVIPPQAPLPQHLDTINE